MAKDIIHDQVKHALIKNGWTITQEHFEVKYKEFQVFIDLAAERSPIVAQKEHHFIVVEIKTFAEPSFIKAFQHALGQYILYRDMLRVTYPNYELYLAISHQIYNLFFTQEATQFIVDQHQLKLLIVNIHREEIVQWIK